MQYITMVLELIRQYPAMHDRLKLEHKLLPTAEAIAVELKARHELWCEAYSQSYPTTDPEHLRNLALHPAQKELENRLLGDSLNEFPEPFTLDEAMTYLKNHAPIA